MSATLSSLVRLPSRATVERFGWAVAILLGTAIFGWLALGLVAGFGLSAKILAAVLAVMAFPVGIFGASALVLLGLIWALDKALGFIARALSTQEPEESTTASTSAEPAPAAPSATAEPVEPTRIVAPYCPTLHEVLIDVARFTGWIGLAAAPGIAAMLFMLHFVASMPVPQFTSSQQRGFEYLGSHPLGGFSPLTPVVTWLGQHPVVANTLLVLFCALMLAGPLYLAYRLAMALYGLVLATAHRLGRFYASTSPVVRKAYRTTKSIVADVYRTSSDIEVFAGWVADLCRRELTKHYLPRVQSALLSSFLKHTNGQRHPRVAAALVACYEATRQVGNRLAVEPSQARHRRAHHLLPVPQPSFEHTVRELVGTGATAD